MIFSIYEFRRGIAEGLRLNSLPSDIVFVCFLLRSYPAGSACGSFPRYNSGGEKEGRSIPRQSVFLKA